jgi:hypothetical protein
MTDLGTRFSVSVKPITGTNVFVSDGAVEAATSSGSARLAAFQEVRLGSKASLPGPIKPAAALASRLAWLGNIPGAGRFVHKKLTGGLVAFWRFDDATGHVARNSVRKDLLAALHGAQWTTGCVGPALSFTRQAYAVVQDSSPLDSVTDEFTIAAWIYISRMHADMKIAARQDKSGPGYKLEVYQGRLGFLMQYADRPNRFIRAENKGVTLRRGVWYHVACTHSAAQGVMRTFVNGSLDRELDGAGKASAPRSGFYIGREPYAEQFYWSGKIDELCVFDRALNESEIKQLAAWPGIR